MNDQSPLARALALRSWRGGLVGVIGALAVYGLELLTPAGWPRGAVASVALLALGLGALVAAKRAADTTIGRARLPWVFVALAAAAWTVGMLVRSAFVIADVAIPTPSLDDVAHLSAAALLIFGFIAMLHGQRLAIYALLLDAGAVVLLLLAAIALLLSSALASEMRQEPLVTTVILLYAVLWSGATGAALSALWGSPIEQPRRAFAILVVGVALNALAFTLSLPVFLFGRFQAGTFLDLLWMLGMVAIGVSAGTWIEDRTSAPRRLFSRDVVELSRLTIPAMTAAFAAALVVIANVSNSGVELFVDSAVAATMVILALRAGLALYTNWRLSEMERRRAVQFEALYEVGLAAAGERSLDELVKLVVEQATQLSRTDGAMLALAEPGNGFIIRALRPNPQLGLRDSVGEPLAGISLAAVDTRDLVVAPRYAEHPRSTKPLHATIASAIAVPLIAHGELVGTLAMYSATPRRFSSDTQRLVRLYAAQAAFAIANARLLAETHRLARDDDLTNVLNRRSLMERLDSEMAGAARHGDIFAVVLCDVDGLKSVNDTAGHLAGNEVLTKVAHIMRESVRAEDVVARFGGDEFVLLLPRTGLLPAQALVGRIESRLREETYHWAGRDHPLPSVSFGIAWFPEDGRTDDALLAVADERMYEDKARSRARREGASGAD
ncbi:MAG TPA: sensor domain-containing diguanylate cyclase [Candidatus Limnocylindria bacterium]|jgi:diguanylate cyclase (GGDEF)-like protein|nr:sensor domain-containing diguanylate cyclase [Candidatus Limnocylindria bacterium]